MGGRMMAGPPVASPANDDRLRVFLFVGSDVSSHILLNHVLTDMPTGQYRPVVIFPKHRPRRGPAQPALKRLAGLERVALQDLVYARLAKKGGCHEAAPCVSPADYPRRYGVAGFSVPNVNDQAFIESLSIDDDCVGLSIRCYQKFGPRIIRAFRHPDGTSRLWNLHPGLLPDYRGVMTFFRAMSTRDHFGFYSLHEIDENWDAGDLLLAAGAAFDYGRSMLSNYCQIAPTAAPMVLWALDELRRKGCLTRKPQSQARSHYYGFPSEREIQARQKSGIRLCDEGEFVEDIRNAFGIDIGTTDLRSKSTSR